MTKKEQHPGGVKLTAKTARTLAMQEFGTARGLTKSTSFVGVYFMEFGNLRTIGSRSLTKADLSEIGERIKYWTNEVSRLENIEARGGRNRVFRVVPRDL